MDPRKLIENLVFSVVRTVVPAAVGSVVAWVARRTSFIIDESTVSGLVMFFTAVVIGVYYLVVRLLETYVAPKFSWFLGDFRKGLTAPVYPAAIETRVVPPSDGD